MPKPDMNSKQDSLVERTKYNGSKRKDSWREFHLNLGKQYAKKIDIPLWLKTEEIILTPAQDVSEESAHYAQELMINFLQHLRSQGFVGDIKVKLGDPCSESDFETICRNPDRFVAYTLVAHDDMVAYGKGDFQKGIIKTWTDTHTKPKMKYPILHELCEFLTPPGFGHCENHPLIKDYSRNEFCALSEDAFVRSVIQLEKALTEPEATLCDQCRDGMNYFWNGLKAQPLLFQD